MQLVPTVHTVVPGSLGQLAQSGCSGGQTNSVEFSTAIFCDGVGSSVAESCETVARAGVPSVPSSEIQASFIRAVDCDRRAAA